MKQEPYRYLFNVAKESVEVIEIPVAETSELTLFVGFFGLSSAGQVMLFSGALSKAEAEERFLALGQVSNGDLVVSSNSGPASMIIPEYLGPITIWNPAAFTAHIAIQLRTIS